MSFVDYDSLLAARRRLARPGRSGPLPGGLTGWCVAAAGPAVVDFCGGRPWRASQPAGPLGDADGLQPAVGAYLASGRRQVVADRARCKV
jgi:hypothetical protein